MGGRKTTALENTVKADQWEERRATNLNRDASLASNIVPQDVATPRGVAITANTNSTDASHHTIA